METCETKSTKKKKKKNFLQRHTNTANLGTGSGKEREGPLSLRVILGRTQLTKRVTGIRGVAERGGGGRRSGTVSGPFQLSREEYASSSGGERRRRGQERSGSVRVERGNVIGRTKTKTLLRPRGRPSSPRHRFSQRRAAIRKGRSSTKKKGGRSSLSNRPTVGIRAHHPIANNANEPRVRTKGTGG